jgi:hypothetical protein
VNAWLAPSTRDAVARACELAADPDQAARLGAAARRDAAQLNAEQLPRRTLALPARQAPMPLAGGRHLSAGTPVRG